MSISMTETTHVEALTAPARDEERWQAVKRRDPAFDGKFLFAVRTTGIYCRPSCASRPAKRENVSFFETGAYAEKAGYRACKRCRPDKLGAPDPQVEAVKRACGQIERAEEAPKLAELAATGSPAAIEASKRAIRGALERPMAEAMQHGWDLLLAHRDHPDSTEGPMAFAEKREPNWEPLRSTATAEERSL